MLSPLFIILHGIAVYFLALWIVLSILYLFSYKVFSSSFFNLAWIILPLFLLIHALAMLYTSNMHSGWFDLEVKACLFLLPLVFYIQHKTFNSFNIKSMKWIYLISISVLCLFLFIGAFIKTIHTQQVHLYYLDFSSPYHPAYLAMYLTLGLIFLIDFFIAEKNKFFTILLFIWIIVLLALVYFLSSKAGILSVCLVFVLASLHYLFKNKKWIKSLLLLIVVALFTYTGISENYRFKSVSSTVQTATTNVSATESNAARWLVWHAGFDLLKQHWLWGVGTGDIKDVLMQEYAKRNMKGALEEKLNAHNQYLETWLAQGLLGIAWLVLIFIYAFKHAFKRNNVPWMMFLVLTGFNFLFESMLNTQGGVIFFAYFYSFFFFEHKINKV